MTKLFVANLPFDVDSRALGVALASFGISARDVRVISNRETGQSRGFGFFEVENPEEAMELLDGFQLGGRPIVVEKAKSPG